MRSSRQPMHTLFAIAAGLLLASCTTQLGGDDGGNAPPVDAAVDAGPPPPDALPPGFRDGEICIVTPEDDTGGCAPGYACTVVGAGPSRCRQICPTLNFSCPDYTGPGFSLCALTQRDDQGQVVNNLCLIVCGDPNETLNGCSDGSCDGTCPGVWTCQNDPNNFGLMTCQ